MSDAKRLRGSAVATTTNRAQSMGRTHLSGVLTAGFWRVMALNEQRTGTAEFPNTAQYSERTTVIEPYHLLKIFSNSSRVKKSLRFLMSGASAFVGTYCGE